MRTQSGSLTDHSSPSIAIWASIAARNAASAVANAACTPSPRPFTTYPSCAATAPRRISSWRANASAIASGSFSHRRIELSRSVNKNVTVPDGNSLTTTPDP